MTINTYIQVCIYTIRIFSHKHLTIMSSIAPQCKYKEARSKIWHGGNISTARRHAHSLEEHLSFADSKPSSLNEIYCPSNEAQALDIEAAAEYLFFVDLTCTEAIAYVNKQTPAAILERVLPV